MYLLREATLINGQEVVGQVFLTNVITFTVPGLPVAQPRQRHRVVDGFGKRTFIQNYIPKKDPVNEYKAAIRILAQNAMNGKPPLEGALGLYLTFILPRPRRLHWKKRPMPRLAHPHRPDCDNLAKSFMDAAQDILWNDDAQVAFLVIAKYFAAGDEPVRTLATVGIIRDFQAQDADVTCTGVGPSIQRRRCLLSKSGDGSAKNDSPWKGRNE